MTGHGQTRAVFYPYFEIGLNYSGQEIGTSVDQKNHSCHVAEMEICGKQDAGLDWHGVVYVRQNYDLGQFGKGKNSCIAQQYWAESVAEIWRGFCGLGSYYRADQKSMTYFLCQ